jgi:hypothetical protein
LHPAEKIVTALFLFTAFAWGASSDGLAAAVRGIVMKGNGVPAANEQVHLENRVTGNLYLADTGKDGSFSIDVPPGWYDLRERSGAVIKSGIRVNLNPLDIGSVVLPRRTSFWRLFQRERLAPVLVESPAPTTVNVSGGSRIPKAGGQETGAGVNGEAPRGALPTQVRAATTSFAGEPAAMQSPTAYGEAQPTSGEDNIPGPVKPNYEPPITPLAAPGVE